MNLMSVNIEKEATKHFAFVALVFIVLGSLLQLLKLSDKYEYQPDFVITLIHAPFIISLVAGFYSLRWLFRWVNKS